MAAEFINNTTDYITNANDTDFNISGTDFTIMMWIYFDAVPSANDGWLVLRRGTTTASTDNFLVRPIIHSAIGNFFRLNFEIVNIANILGNSTLAINTWYHICITKKISTNTYTWYLNGVSDGGTTNSRTLVDKSDVLTLGKGGTLGGNLGLDGKVAFLRFWNTTCLPIEQIVVEMNSAVPQFTTGLILNMPLDLTTGTVADNDRAETANGGWTGTQRWFQPPAVTGARE